MSLSPTSPVNVRLTFFPCLRSLQINYQTAVHCMSPAAILVYSTLRTGCLPGLLCATWTPWTRPQPSPLPLLRHLTPSCPQADRAALWARLDDVCDSMSSPVVSKSNEVCLQECKGRGTGLDCIMGCRRRRRRYGGGKDDGPRGFDSETRGGAGSRSEWETKIRSKCPVRQHLTFSQRAYDHGTRTRRLRSSSQTYQRKETGW